MTLRTTSFVAALMELVSALMDLVAMVGSSSFYLREPAAFLPWGASFATHLSLAAFFAVFWRAQTRPG